MVTKNEIEQEIGYNLICGRNGNRKAICIGRFGAYSTSANKYGVVGEYEDLAEENVVKPYDFNLDVKKVAEELVKFYKVFKQRYLETFNELNKKS